MRSVLCVLVLLASAQPLRAADAEPAMRNYEVRLVGTIRAVDRHTHLVVISYAPLETAPGGVRPVYVTEKRALGLLEVGEAISGLADTRHSPWILRDVRVLR